MPITKTERDDADRRDRHIAEQIRDLTRPPGPEPIADQSGGPQCPAGPGPEPTPEPDPVPEPAGH